MLQQEAIWHNICWQAFTFAVHKMPFCVQANISSCSHFTPPAPSCRAARIHVTGCAAKPFSQQSQSEKARTSSSSSQLTQAPHIHTILQKISKATRCWSSKYSTRKVHEAKPPHAGEIKRARRTWLTLPIPSEFRVTVSFSLQQTFFITTGGLPAV